jgi:hypothetical protein
MLMNLMTIDELVDTSGKALADGQSLDDVAATLVAGFVPKELAAEALYVAARTRNPNVTKGDVQEAILCAIFDAVHACISGA